MFWVPAWVHRDEVVVVCVCVCVCVCERERERKNVCEVKQERCEVVEMQACGQVAAQ